MSSVRKVKFNKFERVAGLFVIMAILGVVGTALSVAIKQGWFDTKIFYTTTFENADGIHQGTVVQMAGLRAGSVDDVELQSDNRIRVSFHVLSKFQERVRQDSSVQLIRPFVIGERVLDLTVGSEKSEILEDLAEIRSTETTDLMTLMSGKTLNSYLGRVTALMDNMKILLDAFADKNRAESIVRVFDRIDPLLKNVNSMSVEMVKLSKQATHDDGVQKLMTNLATTTEEINKILPQLNRENPDLAKNLATMTRDLSGMTQALAPAMKEIEPQLPGASRRLVEALDQTVVVLKAMQKSMFMRGNVREVQEEEQSQVRVPANHK